MIQRIQTIFLALAVLAAAGLFTLPFATTPEVVESSALFADGEFDINDHLLLMISFILAGACSLIAIFLFKRRSVQMSLSILSIIAAIIGLGFGLFTFLSSPIKTQAAFGLGAVLPVLVILFAYLGWRNIKKDDKLVKSIDRLRD